MKPRRLALRNDSQAFRDASISRHDPPTGSGGSKNKIKLKGAAVSYLNRVSPASILRSQGLQPEDKFESCEFPFCSISSLKLQACLKSFASTFGWLTPSLKQHSLMGLQHSLGVRKFSLAMSLYGSVLLHSGPIIPITVSN